MSPNLNLLKRQPVMSSLKKLLATGILVGMNMPLMSPGAQAQIVVTLDGVTAEAPAQGRTESLNVTRGSRTTLAVGNGVQLGTSATMSSSVGTNSVSRSVLVPTQIALSSSIGMTPLVETDGVSSAVARDNGVPIPSGKTNIVIENITANGDGGTINSSSNSTMDVAAGSKYASGNAVIDGMTADSKIEVDTEKVNSVGEASYFASVTPEVVKVSDPFYRDPTTGEVLADDGTNIKADGSSGAKTPLTHKFDEETGYWDTVNACSPTSETECTYVDADVLKTGNASASSNYQTTTNIDINSSDFTTVFGQAF